jgi:Flp pilus assembly protein TadG
MWGQLRRASGAEDGQAVVELALVLPILLLVLFGIFDFGSAVNNWNNETSLANVGARFAAVGSLPNTTADPTCGGTTQTLASYLQCQAQHTYHMPVTSGSYGLQGPVAVKVCAPGGTAIGDPVEVNVYAQYNWLPVSKLLGTGFTNVTLTGAATMRLENSLATSLLTGGTPDTGCTS